MSELRRKLNARDGITISVVEYRNLLDKAMRLDTITRSIISQINDGSKYPVDETLVMFMTKTNDYVPREETTHE